MISSVIIVPVSESRPHPEEALPALGSRDRTFKPEECMMLDGALPQVLTRFLVNQLEHKGMLLFSTL